MNLRRFLFLLCVLLQGCVFFKRSNLNNSNYHHYKIGNSYVVNGVFYKPQHYDHYEEVGIASWYGDGFHNRLTANGDVFNKSLLTAAHKTLPLPSLVEVTNLENGKKVIVKVNDRGPFVDGRVIDVSEKAAIMLGFYRQGTARVRLVYLSRMSHELLRKEFLYPKYYENLAESYRKDFIAAKTSTGYVTTIKDARNAKLIASKLRQQGVQGVRIIFVSGRYCIYAR